MKKDGIKIEGYRGTWYVISEAHLRGTDYRLYLLEHEQYGDMAANLIVTEAPDNGGIWVLIDDSYSGFEDYLEANGLDDFDIVIDA